MSETPAPTIRAVITDEDPLRYYEARSQKSLVPSALRLFSIPTDASTTHLGEEILRHTARIAMAVKKPTLSGEIIPETSQNSIWREGIYTLGFSSEIDGHPTRLFEVGFSADPEGILTILKVQQDRLGQKERKEAHYISAVQKEKHIADQQLRRIKQHLHFRPEIFGFIASIFTLGPHSPTDTLQFPIPSRQPEIVRRTQELHSLSRQKAYRTHLRLRQELRRIVPLVDFAGMLRKIGVSESSFITNGIFRRVPLSQIYTSAETFFTDQQHPGRHQYWKTLQEIKNAQMVTQ